MTSGRTPPIPPDIESLLADERVVVPQPTEVRQRAFARARMAMAAGAGVRGQAHRPLRLGRFRLLVAAAIVLGIASLAAAAFQIRRTVVARREAARSAEVSSQASDRRPAERFSDDTVAPAGDVTVAEPPAAPSVSLPRITTAAESYARELRVLEPARRALARGEFGAVLASVAEHERRFPNGRLAEERDALRVRALFGQRRGDEARRADESFRKAFPKSVLLSGIREKAP